MPIDTIVVLDDESALRRLVIDSLRPHLPDVEFMGTNDVKAGLTYVKKCVDRGEAVAVVVDYRLPKYGGLEVYTALRKHWPRVRVAVLTDMSPREGRHFFYDNNRIYCVPDNAFHQKPLSQGSSVALAEYILNGTRVGHC